MKRVIRSAESTDRLNATEIPDKVQQAIDKLKEPRPYHSSDILVTSPVKIAQRLTFSISYLPKHGEYKTCIFVNNTNHGEFAGESDTFEGAKADLVSQYQKYARWAEQL